MNRILFIYDYICSIIRVKRMVSDMGAYDTAKQIIKDAISLAKKSDNIELYKKIVDAYTMLSDLLYDNINLKLDIANYKNEIKELNDKITELQKDKDWSSKIYLKNECYYIKKENEEDDGKYCMVCWDGNHKLIHMQELDDVNNRKIYVCPVCGFTTHKE